MTDGMNWLEILRVLGPWRVAYMVTLMLAVLISLLIEDGMDE